MAAIQGQVSVGVAGKKHRAKINFQSDGLHPTVHTDVPLSYREKKRHVQFIGRLFVQGQLRNRITLKKFLPKKMTLNCIVFLDALTRKTAVKVGVAVESIELCLRY